MDQRTIEKRDKLFRLAFSSSHSGEILNAVSKLKELGVTELPPPSPQPDVSQKHNLTEKQFMDLIASNQALRNSLNYCEHIISKLHSQLDDCHKHEKKARKRIDTLERRSFIAVSVSIILSIFLIMAIII